MLTNVATLCSRLNLDTVYQVSQHCRKIRERLLRRPFLRLGVRIEILVPQPEKIMCHGVLTSFLPFGLWPSGKIASGLQHLWVKTDICSVLPYHKGQSEYRPKGVVLSLANVQAPQ